MFFVILCLEVTDVAGLVGIECKVADRSNDHVNTTSDGTKYKVCKSSGLPTLGLERGVVDDKATDPTKEEGKKETNYIVVH